MKKNILLILIFASGFQLSLLSKVQPGKWKTIVKDIARDGDADNRGEFEAAKQSFLNISLKGNAFEAAKEIEKTWKNNFPEATAGDKDNPAPGTLMSLKRYPNMQPEDIKLAAEVLLTRDNISSFLNGTVGVEVVEKGTGGTPLKKPQTA